MKTKKQYKRSNAMKRLYKNKADIKQLEEVNKNYGNTILQHEPKQN